MLNKVIHQNSKLWDYINTGNGLSCPLAGNCETRCSGKWCASDNIEYLNKLRKSKRFDIRGYKHIPSGLYPCILWLVEDVANQYLKKGEIRYPPVPTDLVSLFDESSAVEIRSVHFTACHGAIWRLRDNWVIQINATDPLPIQRFTIFHEGFHILARDNTNPMIKERRGMQYSSFNELLADYFAACILEPRWLLEENWQATKDLDKMAKIFNVPKTSLCLRLKRMGLIQ